MHHPKGYPKFVLHGCNFAIFSHGWNLFLTAAVLLIIFHGRMLFLTGVIFDNLSQAEFFMGSFRDFFAGCIKFSGGKAKIFTGRYIFCTGKKHEWTC